MATPYPSYKPSGIDWLGQIPAHWEVVRPKHVARVQSGIAKGARDPLPPSIIVPYLRVANVQDGFLDLADIAEIEISASDLDRYRLQDGDVLMNEGGDYDKLGRGTVWRGQIDPCIHQNHVFAVKCERIEPEWLDLVTSSNYAKWHFILRSKQTTNLASISSTNLMELPVLVPPPAERKEIRRVVETETARIDALVGRKRRLLELLEEKRLAVITHAVTKGLDPNAPMKDSGIDWLGQIPAHWQVKRQKFISPKVTVGIVVTPAAYYVDSGIPALRGFNIKERNLDLSDLAYISEEANELHSKSKIFEGDLVAVRTGQPGTTAVVPTDLDGANCVDLIIIRRSPDILPDFAALFANSNPAKMQYGSGSEGALQQHFNIDTAKNLIVPVPPLSEQKAIVGHLLAEEGKIRHAMSVMQRSVDTLTEYRSALITNAVTGKIDVRGAVERKEAAE